MMIVRRGGIQVFLDILSKQFAQSARETRSQLVPKQVKNGSRSDAEIAEKREFVFFSPVTAGGAFGFSIAEMHMIVAQLFPKDCPFSSPRSPRLCAKKNHQKSRSWAEKVGWRKKVE
jgi:hypothetical protein